MFERWQLWPVKEFNFHQIADNDPLLTAIQRWLDNQLFANFQRKPTLFTRYQISKPIMVSHFDTFTQIKIPLQSSKIVASKQKEKLTLFPNAVFLKSFTIYTLALNLTKESKGKNHYICGLFCLSHFCAKNNIIAMRSNIMGEEEVGGWVRAKLRHPFVSIFTLQTPSAGILDPKVQ